MMQRRLVINSLLDLNPRLARYGVDTFLQRCLMQDRVELVFGLVGPIGCPIHEASEILASCLKKLDYTPVTVTLSAEMDRLLDAKKSPRDQDSDTSLLMAKIKKGNAVREAFGNNAVLASEAVRQIIDFRRSFAENAGEQDEEKLDQQAIVPLDEHAFIIDQLKRPEEIELLVKVFGKRFVQVSVVTPLEQRRRSLVSRLGSEQHGWENVKCREEADKLIEVDQNEKLDDRGQRISKIFHLGDVFFDGSSEKSLEDSSERFIKAFFGRNNIAPTIDEFGSYLAKAASLRSVDLSRQVGAAILNDAGDLISVGCNEVPKSGGGNYWDNDTNKLRDIDLGGEPNKQQVNRMIFDFIEVLGKQGLLVEGAQVDNILSDSKHKKAIKESLVSNVTEYSRAVHAEMNALSDAVRLGRSVAGSTIYVTTYPCHNCAKHLIASGIARIVFIEPYPKSKTESLFESIIAPDAGDLPLVSIEHFFGISPRRYRDIFEKEARQTKEGEVEDWYGGRKAPRIGQVEVGDSLRDLFAVLENLYS